MHDLNFFIHFRYPSFIQSHEPHQESYYKQILTEKEDFMLRETHCDYYYQSGMT